MASITYFSQLQPSPRASSVAESLAARLRDPAWLLARQWQLGEFEGADAGSPAFVRIGSHTAKLTSAQLGPSNVALTEGQLLEPLLGKEAIAVDLATRVEIGQSFELLLAKSNIASSVRDQFRAAYPIALDGPSTDAATARFLRVVSGRAIDGAALYAAAKAAQHNNASLPSQPALDASVQTDVAKAIASFIAWVEATWGVLVTGEPPAWDPTRLEYRVTVTAKAPGGATFTLTGRPDARAELYWYAFDLANSTPASSAHLTFASVIPGHVRFRGMPNARWWDFENDQTDFGAIVPDTRDLGKLLFMDFLLIHGDDWFLAPFDVAVGSLCFIDSLIVTDVFGVTTPLSRADTQGGRWNVFATTDLTTGGFAPFLVIPAAAVPIVSTPVEEVHLLRDETADMAWAIEHVVEGPTGAPRPEPPAPTLAPPTGAPANLAYQLTTPLPPSWFPLLPVAATNGVVTLNAGTVQGGPRAPMSRIVKRLSVPGFQLPDEEVPRAGVRLQRVFYRARSIDGAMHLWIARRKQFGAGEASSGLRYDLATATTR